MKTTAEYIWIDGQVLRSKTKMIDSEPGKLKPSQAFPRWEATVGGVEQTLVPAFYALDPIRKDGVCVLCELYNGDVPAAGNARAALRANSSLGLGILKVGFVQQFSLAVKGDKISRHLVSEVIESHIKACKDSVLSLNYYDASQQPKMIEFELEVVAPQHQDSIVAIADQVLVARYLLTRITDLNDVLVKLGSDHKIILKVTEVDDKTESVSEYSVDFEATFDPYVLLDKILKKD